MVDIAAADAVQLSVEADILLVARSYRITEDFHHGGLFGEDIGAGSELYRIEYTFDKHPNFLALLGDPRVLEVPMSLCDGPVLVTWEDMVMKAPRAYSIGIYLDASCEDPLLVLPGTHRLGSLAEDQIAKVAVQMIHGSGVNKVARPRRCCTWSSGPWSK